MDKEKLERYAALKQEERRIQKDIEDLGPVILQMIEASGHDKVKSTFGTFSVEKRRTYVYTEAVKDAERRVSMMKDEEKASGKAAVKETHSLKYYSPKADVES